MYNINCKNYEINHVILGISDEPEMENLLKKTSDLMSKLKNKLCDDTIITCIYIFCNELVKSKKESLEETEYEK